MTWGQAVLLGVVQGVTEFLPISSDGHLTLLQAKLNLAEASLALDAALHGGTLASILLFFWKDFWNMIRRLRPGEASPAAALERRRIGFIAVATVFTGVVGLSLKPTIEGLVASFSAAGTGFLVSALFLAAGERFLRRGSGKGLEQAPWWNAVLLGLVQGAAVWPGLSRSGSTIATALILGWRWDEAGRFSFLMAAPAVAGAVLLTARDAAGLDWALVGPGVVAAFLAGCLSLFLLMKFLSAKCLWPFAVYCALAGTWALTR